LASQRFAAIVSDERMPGMSGSELLAHVRRRYPGTARVLLNSQASLQAAIHCINEARVARFLEKPCSRETLTEAIAVAIREEEAEMAGRESLAGPAGSRRPGSGAGGEPGGANSFTSQQLATLSEREREVFGLVADGWRIAQIGKRLFISPHTV